MTLSPFNASDETEATLFDYLHVCLPSLFPSPTIDSSDKEDKNSTEQKNLTDCVNESSDSLIVEFSDGKSRYPTNRTSAASRSGSLDNVRSGQVAVDTLSLSYQKYSAPVPPPPQIDKKHVRRIRKLLRYLRPHRRYNTVQKKSQTSEPARTRTRSLNDSKNPLTANAHDLNPNVHSSVSNSFSGRHSSSVSSTSSVNSIGISSLQNEQNSSPLPSPRETKKISLRSISFSHNSLSTSKAFGSTKESSGSISFHQSSTVVQSQHTSLQSFSDSNRQFTTSAEEQPEEQKETNSENAEKKMETIQKGTNENPSSDNSISQKNQSQFSLSPSNTSASLLSAPVPPLPYLTFKSRSANTPSDKIRTQGKLPLVKDESDTTHPNVNNNNNVQENTTEEIVSNEKQNRYLLHRSHTHGFLNKHFSSHTSSKIPSEKKPSPLSLQHKSTKSRYPPVFSHGILLPLDTPLSFVLYYLPYPDYFIYLIIQLPPNSNNTQQCK